MTDFQKSKTGLESGIQESPFALRGAATYQLGSWFGSEKLDAPMVKHYRQTVKVYGNRRDWFLTPETARSMASALNHFADKAEAFND